ncbi:MAG: insulinase family protein [Candidatus Eremiobacteraeota bacterium]|nr:insulinase family protein [Candidatus Eremiobacteraeota bacterium]
MAFLRAFLLSLATAALLCRSATALPAETGGALTATLRNGLRVVIVRNTIAPVISTDMTYLVGSRDDPANVPGLAHAQEHMMFRGTRELSTSQLGTIATALGGAFNASTSDTLTQFQFTVPSTDFDAILRIESDRMRDVLDAQSQWENERGAIEQEVLRDESSPGGDFFNDVQALAFAGTPYARQGVGTRAAFDRLTGPQIHAFYEKWYAPNNAVFTVAGDLDPAEALAAIRARFEAIPARKIEKSPTYRFAPIKRTVIRRSTSLVYALAAVGFRMPGIDSPDFLPSYVLQAVLDSQRGPLRRLADSGDALESEWLSLPYFDEGQLAFATAALAPGTDPGPMERRLEAMMTEDARSGVPRELFEATKRRLITDQEESRNSIEALASDWATTIALDREPSIAREQQLIANVTFEQVNRAAARYLDVDHAIGGALTPSSHASQSAPPAPPAQGSEKPLDTQNAATDLPPWGSALLHSTSVPASTLAPVRTKLANGITLLVQPETISNSVFVYGSVKSNPELEEPQGKEGVASILDGVFEYGSQTMDRLAFARAQDDIDSSVQAGTGFGVQTTPAAFARAVDLLAQIELHPRLDRPTFELARRRAGEALETSLNGSHTAALIRAAQKLLPPGDPELRRPSLEGLGALTLDDVTAYYDKTLRPDLTTIVVIGNVSPDVARATVERAFGAWHATGDPPALDLPAIPVNEPGEVKLTLPTFGQDSVTFEQILALTRSSPQYYPLELGNAILGGRLGRSRTEPLFSRPAPECRTRLHDRLVACGLGHTSEIYDRIRLPSRERGAHLRANRR